MLKFSRVLCAVLVCIAAGSAFAAVVKVRALAACGAGASENPECDGMAIFHYKADTGATEVNVVITNFQADTTYSVRYEDQFTTGGSEINAITTNASGNGHVHITHATGDVSSLPRVIIFVDEDQDFDYTPGEERACGGTNCVFY